MYIAGNQHCIHALLVSKSHIVPCCVASMKAGLTGLTIQLTCHIDRTVGI